MPNKLTHMTPCAFLVRFQITVDLDNLYENDLMIWLFNASFLLHKSGFFRGQSVMDYYKVSEILLVHGWDTLITISGKYLIKTSASDLHTLSISLPTFVRQLVFCSKMQSLRWTVNLSIIYTNCLPQSFVWGIALLGISNSQYYF